MAIELCVLASGSSGNCTVVRTPAGVMLIDAGIGPRMTSKRLDGTGILLSDIRAICLTHLDSDHFRPSWVGSIIKRGIRIFCHRQRMGDVVEILGHEGAAPLVSGFADAFSPLPDLHV